MAKKKGKQLGFFNNGEELPLFTGTPIPVEVEVFNPPPKSKQLVMFKATWQELAEGKQYNERKQNDPTKPVQPSPFAEFVVEAPGPDGPGEAD